MRGSGPEGPPSHSRAQPHPWVTPLTPSTSPVSSVGRGVMLEGCVGQARVRAAGVLHPAPQHRRFQPRPPEGAVCHCVLALVVAPLCVLRPTVMGPSLPMSPKGAHVAQYFRSRGTLVRGPPTPRSSGAPLPCPSPEETARHRAVALWPHLPQSCGALERWHLQRGKLRPGRAGHFPEAPQPPRPGQGVPCPLASTLSMSDHSLCPGLAWSHPEGLAGTKGQLRGHSLVFSNTREHHNALCTRVPLPQGRSWARRPTPASQAGTGRAVMGAGGGMCGDSDRSLTPRSSATGRWKCLVS